MYTRLNDNELRRLMLSMEQMILKFSRLYDSVSVIYYEEQLEPVYKEVVRRNGAGFWVRVTIGHEVAVEKTLKEII